VTGTMHFRVGDCKETILLFVNGTRRSVTGKAFPILESFTSVIRLDTDTQFVHQVRGLQGTGMS
jgi:hypothetical protein